MECDNCKNKMDEVCETGKSVQVGEYVKQENSELSIWQQTGIKTQILYQCPVCKTIKAD
jgi:hypothetical protein